MPKKSFFFWRLKQRPRLIPHRVLGYGFNRKHPHEAKCGWILGEHISTDWHQRVPHFGLISQERERGFAVSGSPAIKTKTTNGTSHRKTRSGVRQNKLTDAKDPILIEELIQCRWKGWHIHQPTAFSSLSRHSSTSCNSRKRWQLGVVRRTSHQDFICRIKYLPEACEAALHP